MPPKNEIRRSRDDFIASAYEFHRLLWETWAVLLRFVTIGLWVIMAPLMAIIIMADLVIAVTILTVVGLVLAFVTGWITPSDALSFLNDHAARTAAHWSSDLKTWSAAHPNSPVGQLLQTGETSP